MNSIVSLPIAAAVPVASPCIAAANDPKAELARLEQAVELLRTRHVCEGWKMDEAGAERALSYFRAGCPDDDEEWGATLFFISSHGLSLDWICDGNVGPMICRLASQSPRAKDIPDPIFASIEDHKRVYAALTASVHEQSKLEEELPKDKRKSNIDSWEEKIVDTDDPRWIAAEKETDRLIDAELDAAVTLVAAKPATLAGVVALLEYSILHDERDDWPSDLVDDEGHQYPWSYFMHQNILEALTSQA